ncbi:TetR/AcrR family transcriptional regulator [Holophaga foetida]|uniref:TetR/AcrR family transcriptional regulator n=1 Tax=Holophaga foetida TaxID=35839 RepID=UPI00024749CC|nr:TetR/AcrR family transcriptional regulator [Holophaga foetida]
MKNKETEHAIHTRERLILAAIQVFASKNFEGASIREISKKADANSALIQYYFGGKEGLYLEAVKFVFKIGSDQFDKLPPPPDPSHPCARAEATLGLKDFIRLMVWLTCTCPNEMKNLYGPDFEQAAFSLWSQAIQTMRPSIAESVREMVTPLTRYLNGCISVLRPDLPGEEQFRMAMSTMAQITHLHTHMQLVTLHRGAFYTESEMDSLSDHFIQFSLRGLGIPEAFPAQGA